MSLKASAVESTMPRVISAPESQLICNFAPSLNMKISILNHHNSHPLLTSGWKEKKITFDFLSDDEIFCNNGAALLHPDGAQWHNFSISKRSSFLLKVSQFRIEMSLTFPHGLPCTSVPCTLSSKDTQTTLLVASIKPERLSERSPKHPFLLWFTTHH